MNEKVEVGQVWLEKDDLHGMTGTHWLIESMSGDDNMLTMRAVEYAPGSYWDRSEDKTLGWSVSSIQGWRWVLMGTPLGRRLWR